MAVKDLVVLNGYRISGVPGLSDNPHFETFEGLKISGEEVSTVDGVTNKRKKFSGQVVDFGDLTMGRPFQSNEDDYALQILAMACIKLGYKFDVLLIKYHKSQEIFNILLKDFRIKSVNFPTFDVESVEKMVVTYEASCDDAYLVPVQFSVQSALPSLVPTRGLPADV